MASIEVDFTCQFTVYKREGVSDEEAVEEASEAVQRALDYMEGAGFDYDNDTLESLLVAQWIGEKVQLGSEELAKELSPSDYSTHQLKVRVSNLLDRYTRTGSNNLELKRQIGEFKEELDSRLQPPRQ